MARGRFKNKETHSREDLYGGRRKDFMRNNPLSERKPEEGRYKNLYHILEEIYKGNVRHNLEAMKEAAKRDISEKERFSKSYSKKISEIVKFFVRNGRYGYALEILDVAMEVDKNDIVFKSQYLDILAKSIGDPVKVWGFFENIENPDSVTYSTMISFYADLYEKTKSDKYFKKAEELFTEAKSSNKIDVGVYNSYLKLLTIEGEEKRAEELLKRIKNPTPITYSTMISFYADLYKKRRDNEYFEKARALFNASKNHNKVDIGVYSSYLKLLTIKGDEEQVKELFEQIKNPNSITYSTMISFYADLYEKTKSDKYFKKAEELFAKAKNSNKVDVSVYNSYLKLLIIKGDEKTLEKIFKEIKNPNSITYSTMISFYAELYERTKNEEYLEKAKALSTNAKRNNKISVGVYNSYLKMLTVKGEKKEIEEFFNQIKDPDNVTYRTFLTYLYKREEYAEIVKFMNELKERGNLPLSGFIELYITGLEALRKLKRWDELEKELESLEKLVEGKSLNEDMLVHLKVIKAYSLMVRGRKSEDAKEKEALLLEAKKLFRHLRDTISRDSPHYIRVLVGWVFINDDLRDYELLKKDYDELIDALEVALDRGEGNQIDIENALDILLDL